MVSYLMEYGMPITFLQWMKYGMPFVPLMAVVIGGFIYLACKPWFAVKNVNPSEVVKAMVADLPKFGRRQAMMAAILVVLVTTWVVIGEHAGLGAPTLYALMGMFLRRIIRWEDVRSEVAFDVVGLYAAASAMGVGLKFTGGILWLAQSFVDVLPEFLSKGEGLVIGVSLLTGTMTNFMRDDATVAAIFITTNMSIKRLEGADREFDVLNSQLIQSDKMAALGKMAAGTGLGLSIS